MIIDQTHARCCAMLRDIVIQKSPYKSITCAICAISRDIKPGCFINKGDSLKRYIVYIVYIINAIHIIKGLKNL